MNINKGMKIIMLTILCLVIAYMPKIIGNDEYKSDVETVIESITLDQTIPTAGVVLLLGLVLIAITKECGKNTFGKSMFFAPDNAPSKSTYFAQENAPSESIPYV